ncbi:MAG: hypothetical protein KGJ90_06300 [Patescibacteria group bacterium]|nr:hypothetical protein [Patescibacteria group bacterium]
MKGLPTRQMRVREAAYSFIKEHADRRPTEMSQILDEMISVVKEMEKKEGRKLIK